MLKSKQDYTFQPIFKLELNYSTVLTDVWKVQPNMRNSHLLTDLLKKEGKWVKWFYLMEMVENESLKIEIMEKKMLT